MTEQTKKSIEEGYISFPTWSGAILEIYGIKYHREKDKLYVHFKELRKLPFHIYIAIIKAKEAEGKEENKTPKILFKKGRFVKI